MYIIHELNSLRFFLGPFFFSLGSLCLALLVEQLNIDLFKKTLGPVQKVMKDADLKLSEVDEIVLVGGSTRIPKVSNKTKSSSSELLLFARNTVYVRYHARIFSAAAYY